MSRSLIVVLTAILWLTVCHGDQDQETAFYVSPSGNDNATGNTAQNAFASLGRARAAIRALKQAAGLTAPVTVYLREGRHTLKVPIVLTPQDSGTEAYPVKWTAYPGENPVVTGARRITGWRVTDKGLWTVTLPDVAKGSWYFSSLYAQGKSLARTRLPKKGYFRITDFPNKDKDPWAAGGGHFSFSPGDIRSDWKNLPDVEVVVLRFWVSSRQHIKSVDDNNVVRFGYPTRYRYSDDFTTKGARYYVENVFEALDEPGEWYLDRPTGTLYYYPRPGDTPVNTAIEAPLAAQLLRFEGQPEEQSFVEHISYTGIHFTQNNWKLPAGNAGDGQSAPAVEGAVCLKGARNCTIAKCQLDYLTSYAIQIDAGCRDNRICHNELGHLGGGGIRMGGAGVNAHPDLRTGGNLIADNHIHHIGEVYHAATGIWIQHSGGNTITHNEIDHTYYSSIAIGWVWGYTPSITTHNEISFNHIHHVGQGVLSDMGGIYMLGVAPGTVVKNNLIHDIESHGYGGWGIYTDEGSSHILIENNIVYNTKCAGFDQHFGRENLIRNNIFAFGHEDLIHRSRVEEHISFLVERNILYGKGETPILGGQWDKKAYMHRPGKPWHEPVQGTLNHVFDYNLYFNPDQTMASVQFGKMSFEQWQASGQDEHSLYADPLFADPENGDFSLAPDSPVFRLGFQPIDTSTVGPRKP